MDQQKQSAIDRLKQATNVLVTVNSNPTVDQLAACIGLTIMLNGLGKHGTAVFSGAVPSTIGFLQPEKTLEKNTDSLRDFIIALDKSKADKLRYKVEDTVVKIFITPYRTSINEKDLEFSQGDFNVDVVVALGVHDQKELDQAITQHGRILHDATIISINTQPGNNLGTINWQDPQASSLSEMVASMADSFDKKVLDNQVATALLTGIVAETERFSNDKTSPNTMKVSAQLMAAGANQQLVAEKLEEPPQAPPPDDGSVHGGGLQPPQDPPKPSDGTLQIDHPSNRAAANDGPPGQPQPPESDALSKILKSRDEAQIQVDENGQMSKLGDNRQILQGPGPSDAQSVLPSMQETELPSGVPNATQEFSYDPTAPAGPPPDDSQPGNNDSPGSPADQQSNAQILQHDDQPGQAQSDSSQDTPAGMPQEQPHPAPPAPQQLPSDPPPQASEVPAPQSGDSFTPPNDASLPSATQIPDYAMPAPGSDTGNGSKSDDAPPANLNDTTQASSQSAPLTPQQSPIAPRSEPPKSALPNDSETLTEIEKDMQSPHLQAEAEEARAEVETAEQSGPPPVLEAIAALNAQPMGGSLHDDTKADSRKSDDNKNDSTPTNGKLAEPLATEDAKNSQKDNKKNGASLPDALKPAAGSSKPPTSTSGGPTPPPPVPPPMMPIPPTNG